MIQTHPPSSRGLLLLRLELQLFLRQRFVGPALLVFGVLCVGAASEGIYRIAQQRATVHRLREAEAKRLLDARALAIRLDQGQATAGPFRDPRRPSNFVRLVLSTPAVKPLLPAAVLDVGQADLLPFYFMLNTGPASKSTTTYEYGNPQQLLLGKLDLSLVLVFLLPLFLTILGYRIGSLERENGVAPLLQVACDHPSSIYARRLVMAAFPLVFLYLTIASGTIFLEAYRDSAPLALFLRTILLLVTLTLLYTGFWLAMMLVVMRHSRTASAGLLRLSLGWTTVCILIPALANQFAAAAHPTLSRPEYVNRLRAATDDLTRDPHRLYERYLELHPEERTGAPLESLPSAGAMSLVAAEMSDRAAEQTEAEVLSAQIKQERLVRFFSFVSPAMLMQAELDRLAGEDTTCQRIFLHNAHQHIDTLREFYRDALLHDSILPKLRFERLLQYPRFSR